MSSTRMEKVVYWIELLTLLCIDALCNVTLQSPALKVVHFLVVQLMR